MFSKGPCKHVLEEQNFSLSTFVTWRIEASGMCSMSDEFICLAALYIMARRLHLHAYLIPGCQKPQWNHPEGLQLLREVWEHWIPELGNSQQICTSESVFKFKFFGISSFCVFFTYSVWLLEQKNVLGRIVSQFKVICKFTSAHCLVHLQAHGHFEILTWLRHWVWFRFCARHAVWNLNENDTKAKNFNIQQWWEKKFVLSFSKLNQKTWHFIPMEMYTDPFL
jgi:hypothetical protein